MSRFPLGIGPARIRIDASRPFSSPVSRSDTGEVARPKAVTEGAQRRIIWSRRWELNLPRAPSVTPLRGAPPPPRLAPQGRWRESASLLAGLSVFVVAFCLTACGHSDATHFFTLFPVAPAQPAAAAWVGPPIRLRRVAIPPALDRVELVRETAPGEVKISDFEHWAAPLGQTAVQVLAQDLAARLPAGAVIPPAAPLPPSAVDVDVDILAFNVADGQAVMQVSWSEIARPSAGPKGAQTSSTRLVELAAPLDASGGLAEAQGLSRLLGELADRIARAR